MVAALLLGVEVARLGIASGYSDTRPQLAARSAPHSPTSLVSTAMTEVGEAAATGGDPSSRTMGRLQALAAIAPLRPEPFLVQAALAERAADYARATQLLDQARLRDPRSPAARYLIADVSLRQNKVLEGLREMAVLSRLLPGTSVQLVPALSQYAQTPGAAKNLASILEQNPQLRNPLFDALSADPDNAGLILALADGRIDSTRPDTQRWESRLLLSLVKRGDYDRAYSIWQKFSGLPQGPRPLLFNGDFREIAAPPPFNWDFSGGKAGVSEAEKGRLRILYYGREDAVIATQMLLLPPGSYRFAAPVSGQVAPNALTWALACVGGTRLMGSWLSAESGQGETFTVPSLGCGAQQLELRGHAQDAPQDTDIHIGSVSIERAGA